jgi:hypothetical protein
MLNVFMLSVIMLGVIMLGVIILGVIMLGVIMLGVIVVILAKGLLYTLSLPAEPLAAEARASIVQRSWPPDS